MATKSEILYQLEEDLAPWLPRENDTNVLLSAAAEGVSELDQEITEVLNGLTLRKASTKEELDQISRPLNMHSPPSENLETYRNRILQNFQLLTRNGSPEDILELASNLLDLQKTDIKLKKVDGEPKFRISAPISPVKKSFENKENATSILLDATGASYGIEIFGTGTLEYITPEERNTSSYDSSQGYATLDGDGNVTEGGTYSGYYI